MTPKAYMKKALNSDLKYKNYVPIVKRLNQYERNKAHGKSDKSLMRILHGAIGISGEAGEILDTLKKTLMYDKPLDLNHIKEECGDLLWYMAILLDEAGLSFQDVMKANIKKLEKRYPKGFTEAAAKERKDKKK